MATKIQQVKRVTIIVITSYSIHYTKLYDSTVFELQSLVDSHQHPFVVIDRDYQILAVNKAYEKTYGVGKERTVGLPCFKISHDNDSPCCRSGEDCPHEYLSYNFV